MGIIEGIRTLIAIVRVAASEKKKMEANAAAYFSQERARRARLYLEKLFKALEDGEANPNFAKLPKIVRWFCGGTQVDNCIGTFGGTILKSQKTAEGSPILREDIDTFHGV